MDDEALPGDAEATGPWTIKGIPASLRRAIMAEARKEGATVAVWLERRMTEWQTIVTTRADQDDKAQSALVLEPGRPLPPAGLGELAQAMNAARQFAEAAGVKVPAQLARDSLALVKQATRAARGLPASTRERSKTPVPALPALPPSRAATILAELDARGAPDEDYRAAFSTFSKVPLRRGESWRARLVAHVADINAGLSDKPTDA